MHLCEPNGLNKTYGFVDYVDQAGADNAVSLATSASFDVQVEHGKLCVYNPHSWVF